MRNGKNGKKKTWKTRARAQAQGSAEAVGPEGAPFIGAFTEEAISAKPTQAIRKALYFCEGAAQCFGRGKKRPL